MRVAVYARVSTLDQDPEVQLRELRDYAARRRWGDPVEFVDHGVSGAKMSRDALDRLMNAARRRQFDVVLVWRFDRFARSARHLVMALDEFRELDVAFVSLSEAIDTTTALGRAMFTIVAAIAEFERELIRERVRAGVAKARASGRRLGRPRREIDLDYVRGRLKAGDSLRELGRSLGVHHATLSRALRAKT